MRIIEKKGLGMAVNTAIVGEEPRKEHRERAEFLSDDIGGFNARKVNNTTEDESYGFPEMVSEEKASAKYKGWK